MIPKDPPRVCTKCTPIHIENCPDCYGFGLVAVSNLRVRAADACNEALWSGFVACQTCGSDYRGWKDA